jgi:hypothetical protein
MTRLQLQFRDVHQRRGLPVPAPTYRWLCDYIADCWTEGNLAHVGFALDDLAGLSWPLGQLTPEQR